MMFEYITVLLFIIVPPMSYLASLLYRSFALRRGMLAAVNQRSAHETPVPTGSGLVLVLLFFVLLLILMKWQVIASEVFLICLGPLLVGVVGYIDDRGELAVKARTPVYLLAACWCSYLLGFPDLNINGMVLNFGFIGWIFGVISLFWLQNLFNFMDGTDGIAAAEVVFVCFSALAISGAPMEGWPLVCLICALLALGYLFINWPMAKLFMGDAGSNFFGLMLGVFILSSDSLSIWVWMILLSQFLVDACLTISIRMSRRVKIYESHSQHAYQHLNRLLGSSRLLCLTITINLVWLLPIAIFAHLFPDNGFLLLVLAVLPIIVKDWCLGAGGNLPRVAGLRGSVWMQK